MENYSETVKRQKLPQIPLPKPQPACRQAGLFHLNYAPGKSASIVCSTILF